MNRFRGALVGAFVLGGLLLFGGGGGYYGAAEDGEARQLHRLLPCWYEVVG